MGRGENRGSEQGQQHGCLALVHQQPVPLKLSGVPPSPRPTTYLQQITLLRVNQPLLPWSHLSSHSRDSL